MKFKSYTLMTIVLAAALSAMLGASPVLAQQAQSKGGQRQPLVKFGKEVTCNAGPVTWSSSGSRGVQGAGTVTTYNPRTGQACTGLNAQGGLGGYGRASGQVCGDRNGNTYLKGSVGAGTGVGVDAASAGCTVQGTVQVRVPTFKRAPITTYVGK